MTAAERTPVVGVAPDDNLRVLVVEDDESIRRMICRRLRQAGLEVLSAASGEEAVALCHDAGPAVHLLVTDGIMPGMDGFDLARVFAQRNPPVRAILISGFMGHFVARSDIPENVEAFFPKPFSGEELVAKILDLLGATA
jgi:CheY-like chemotaxis protein